VTHWGEKKVERKQQPLLYLLYIFPTTKVFKEVGNFFKSTTSKLGIFPAAFILFYFIFLEVFSKLFVGRRSQGK
jgi:hypothetical protein